MIDIGLLILAFTSGIFAFFTPCSVALIPGYIGYLVKSDKGSNALRGIKVGLVSAAGLLSVFMGLGLLISIFGNFIAPYVFWVGVMSGTGLVVLGLYLLTGRTFFISISHATSKQKGIKGYFVFGATYGLASLSCTLPVFLLVMSQALSVGGGKSGLAVFLIYSLTAAAFMAVVAYGAITLKDLTQRYLKKMLGVILKLSPYLIIFAGVYMIYFQLRAFYF